MDLERRRHAPALGGFCKVASRDTAQSVHLFFWLLPLKACRRLKSVSLSPKGEGSALLVFCGEKKVVVRRVYQHGDRHDAMRFVQDRSASGADPSPAAQDDTAVSEKVRATRILESLGYLLNRLRPVLCRSQPVVCRSHGKWDAGLMQRCCPPPGNGATWRTAELAEIVKKGPQPKIKAQAGGRRHA